MPQKWKYDRETLFLEYLTDDEIYAESFLRKKWVVKPWKKGQLGYSGAMKVQTRGRAEKKKKFQEKAMQRAVLKLEKEVAEKIYKPSIKELNEMHRRTMDIWKIVLNDMTIISKDKDGNTTYKVNKNATRISKELRNIREIVKTEKWEPTRTILDLTPVPEEKKLDEKQQAILEKYKSKKKW